MNFGDFNTNSFGTHRPCLLSLIKNTTGNIIEFGCGDSSTVLIKKAIKGSNRKLFTIESNEEWMNKYKHLQDENHKFHFIDAGNVDSNETGQKWIDYIENSDIKNINFDVVFIDSSPWTSRTYIFDYYKNKAKYIIVHDCGYFVGASGLHHHKNTGTKNLWGTVKKYKKYNQLRVYDMDFTRVAKNYQVYYPYLKYFSLDCGPATLLLSNIVSAEEFDIMRNKIYENNKYYDKNLQRYLRIPDRLPFLFTF